MKLAIISDIHGNLEALQAVLADIDRLAISDLICLGDCIGYGPDSEEVMAVIRNRSIPMIIGNHELAVGDKRYLNWFNPNARISVEKAIANLSDQSVKMIKALPTSIVTGQCRFVHGYPPDDAKEYLFQKRPHQLIKTFKAMKERVCFVGHTHDLELVRFDGRQVERVVLKQGLTQLLPDMQYLINVGSVGQPRDGDNHAKYVIYDAEKETIEVKFIAYDISATVEKIKAAGLPVGHANRLW